MGIDIQNIAKAIETQGYAFVPASDMRALLSDAAQAGWQGFSESWHDLARDTYMADGGRYRRRRHAVFHLDENDLTRKPHQPHYQSRDHNNLNGGLQRWFEPVAGDVAEAETNRAVLELCQSVFGAAPTYEVEMHQFRIEPSADGAGKPTPEGVHRDGVDWVCVMLMNRENVSEGVTGIYTPDENSLGNFTLTEPMDCVFLNDHRVLHGVTPINLIDPHKKGFRDVAVWTFKAAP
jgi:hypothetical protein